MPATVEDRPRVRTDDRPRPLIRRLAGRLRPAWTRRPGLLRRPVWTRRRVATLIRVGVVAVTILGALRAVEQFGRHYIFLDMNVYHGAMVWWTHGNYLYDYIAPNSTLGFTYPPFAALVMAPIATMPTMVAGWVNAAASVAALAVLLAWLLVPVADRYGWRRWFVVALAVPLAGATEPIRETLGFGQINILLALLIYADFVALRNRAMVAARPDNRPAGGVVRRLWCDGALAGVGVGLAAAIKVTPGIFTLYFAVTRQWRAALVSATTTVGASLLTFAVSGRAATDYFTSVLFDTSRVGAVDATANQSLAGVLARLYDSPTTPTLMWLAFAALVLAVGMIRGGGAHNDGDELAAFTIVGLTGNAICPISWSHHLVFVIPALIVLGDSALRRHKAARGLASRHPWTWGPAGVPALAGLSRAIAALGVYALFVVSPIWRFEHKLPTVSHYADGLHGAFWENSLALAIIGLVVLLPWRPGADPAFYPEPSLARRAAAARARMR